MYGPNRYGGMMCGAAVALLTVSVFVAPAHALLGGSIGGTFDLSAVQADVDGVGHQTLRQEYSLRMSRNLLPFVVVRGTIRYLKFDIDQTADESAWREELQPGAELVWRHPSFLLSTSVLHRSLRGRNSIDGLATDNLGFLFRTSDFRYPILSASYDLSRSEDTGDGTDRNVEDRRLQAGFDYSALGQTFNYAYSRRMSENIITNLETERDDHLFHWSNNMATLLGGRVRVVASYRLNHSIQVDTHGPSGEFLQTVEAISGLFAEDNTPDFGELEVVTSLVDENRSDPTSPAIDVGGALEDQNIGADLGFEREISAIYLYTDRASGGGPTWSVFGSQDNLSWDLWTDSPTVDFNSGLNRYEILFDPGTARYVKVVKEGINEISSALVTEIEVFERVDGTDSVEAEWTAHYGDLYSNLRIARSLTTTMNLSYQHRPTQIGKDGRDDAVYAFSTKFEPATWVAQTARWQQDFQGIDRDEVPDLTTNTASYSLEVDPLETIGLGFSAISTINLDRKESVRETNGLLAQVRGVALSDLNLVGEISRSRNTDYIDRTKHDTWRQQYSVDAAVTRSMQTAAQYSIQNTESRPSGTKRTRQAYGFDLNYRLTQTILLRGSLNIVEDNGQSMTQDYFVSWRITPKLTSTAQGYFIDPGEGRGTRRFSGHINYKINPRSSLYLSFSRIELAGTGGGETTSFQQGFRTTF